MQACKTSIEPCINPKQSMLFEPKANNPRSRAEVRIRQELIILGSGISKESGLLAEHGRKQAVRHHRLQHCSAGVSQHRTVAWLTGE